MSLTSNLVSKVLSRLATVKNSTVANALETDESFISRFASGERGLRLQQIEPFFEELGLKVIECSGEVVQLPLDEYQALVTLARKALK
jgi:hypothetical protein